MRAVSILSFHYKGLICTLLSKGCSMVIQALQLCSQNSWQQAIMFSSFLWHDKKKVLFEAVEIKVRVMFCCYECWQQEPVTIINIAELNIVSLPNIARGVKVNPKNLHHWSPFCLHLMINFPRSVLLSDKNYAVCHVQEKPKCLVF